MARSAGVNSRGTARAEGTHPVRGRRCTARLRASGCRTHSLHRPNAVASRDRGSEMRTLHSGQVAGELVSASATFMLVPPLHRCRENSGTAGAAWNDGQETTAPRFGPNYWRLADCRGHRHSIGAPTCPFRRETGPCSRLVLTLGDDLHAWRKTRLGPMGLLAGLKVHRGCCRPWESPGARRCIGLAHAPLSAEGRSLRIGPAVDELDCRAAALRDQSSDEAVSLLHRSRRERRSIANSASSKYSRLRSKLCPGGDL